MKIVLISIVDALKLELALLVCPWYNGPWLKLLMQDKENSVSQTFLDLVVKLETAETLVQNLKDQLVKEMELVGVGSYVQDPLSLLVHRIVEPKGAFIYYPRISYVRTAKPEERSGTLSKKEAQEAGFILAAK